MEDVEEEELLELDEDDVLVLVVELLEDDELELELDVLVLVVELDDVEEVLELLFPLA